MCTKLSTNPNISHKYHHTMDDQSGLLQQLQKYQHQNKNLLSENAKLHAKSKRLKMEKKRLKLKLQTQMQNSNKHSDTQHHDISIATKTLEFVHHHHIEMQRMIDNLISHPTIIKSSTHKDLQYISSKLSYIQSKVTLLTNGKTCISSPSDLHSHTHSHSPPNYKSSTPSISASDHETECNLPSYTPKKPMKYGSIRNLTSRSSPHKTRQSLSQKVKTDYDGDNGLDSQYHRRNQSHPDSHTSLQHQLRQLDLDKYINKNKNRRSTETALIHKTHSSAVSENDNNLLLPVRKQRSTIISSSTSDCIMDNMVPDLPVPSLPSSPSVYYENTRERPQMRAKLRTNKAYKSRRSFTQKKGNIKSDSVTISESPISTVICGASSDTNSTFSPSQKLISKYKERTQERSEASFSISNVNFVYEFNSEIDDENDHDMESQHKTYQQPLHLNHNELSHQNVNIKGSANSFPLTPNTANSRNPPSHNAAHLRVDLSQLQNAPKPKANLKKRRHAKTFTTELPENAEKMAGKWRLDRSYDFPSPTLTKASNAKTIHYKHPNSKSETALTSQQRKQKRRFLQKPVREPKPVRECISASVASPSDKSNTGSGSTSISNLRSNSGSTSDAENKSISDGESDDYYDSSTEINEHSAGVEGAKVVGKSNSKSKSKSYKIDVSPAAVHCEGAGGGDDFFDATNSRSPFKLANNEKNIFTPSAISPYGFLAKSKRSKTVSAMDMYRKKNRKMNRNGYQKHNSFTYIDHEKEEKKGSNFNVDQIKREMLHQYQQQNQRRNSIELNDAKAIQNAQQRKKGGQYTDTYLSPTSFLSESDGDGIVTRVRSLSLEEKQKLLVIDDLIASILEDKNSYLQTNALLLSYQAFTTSLLLMKVLRRRFRVPHDYVYKQMKKNKKNHTKSSADNESDIAFKIQLGICQILYAWMHKYWEQDFMNKPRLQTEIFEFQSDVDKFIIDRSQINAIQKLLKEPKNLCSTNALFSKASNFNANPFHKVSISSESESIASRSLQDANEEIRTRWPHLMKERTQHILIPDEFQILHYKSFDIGQQIVLMDYCVFKEIRAREVVAQAWKKKDKWEKARNLLRMIGQFNSVCRWIQIAIINHGKSPKQRAKMIKHMILMAKTLRDYQDFSALCAVHSALVSTPIKRLTKSWKKVKKKYIRIIQNISALFKWNSPKLVELHLTSKGPVIPHLGIVLKNVICIEESHEYKPDGTINAHKMNLLAQQIETLSNWQLKCNKIYNNRHLNKNNKKFEMKPDLILQKLLFRDFEQQINVNDDDIFEMILNKNIE